MSNTTNVEHWNTSSIKSIDVTKCASVIVILQSIRFRFEHFNILYFLQHFILPFGLNKKIVSQNIKTFDFSLPNFFFKFLISLKFLLYEISSSSTLSIILEQRLISQMKNFKGTKNLKYFGRLKSNFNISRATIYYFT